MEPAGHNPEHGSGQGTGWPLLTALRFLTIFPISHGADSDESLFARSLVWFPVVAIIIGAIGGLLAMGAAHLLPGGVAALLLIGYLGGVSGFLHLDGLADSADGLLSARPRERALAIMRDSRTGAMGVIGLILVVLGKYSALSHISSPAALATAGFCLPLAGRYGILCSMALLPYARPEGGLGSLFYGSSSKPAALLSMAVLFGGVLLATEAAVAIVMVLAVSVVLGLFGLLCKSRIGGATGDTLGAACELAELTAAIVLGAALYGG